MPLSTTQTVAPAPGRAAERPVAVDLRRPLPRPAQAASVGPGDGVRRKGVGVVGVKRHGHPAILLIL